MSHIFVDSGGWIALLKRDEADHAATAKRYAQISAEHILLITSNYVVDETATRLRYDVGLAAALQFRELLQQAVAAGRLRMVWVDEGIENEAWRILEQYSALRLSLTDATSGAIARKRRLTEVFGLDSHFEALGFTVLPD